MKNETMKELVAWRAEIDPELAEAKAAAPPLQAAAEAATAEYRAALASYQDLQLALDALGRLSPALTQRAGWRRGEVDEAHRRSVVARGALEAARARVTELTLALRQIDQLLEEQNELSEAA